MFTTRFLTTTLLLAAGVWATNHTGIPQAFSTGFVPDFGLQINYDTAGKVTDGADLTGQDLSKVPKFALGESSGINTSAKFIVLMVDPDVNGDPEVVSPQTLHYLRTDFIPSGKAVDIASESAPAVKYVGPEATVGGNSGPHRYVFLLYKQPKEGFALKGVSADTRAGFNVKAWREANGLEAAVAGVHFLATPPGAVAGNETIESAASTPCTASAVATSPAGTGSAESQEQPQTIIHTVTVTGACDCTSTTPDATTSADSGLTPTDSPPTLTASLVETPTATESLAEAPTHSVTVGGIGSSALVYTPEFINANPGDIVHFDFMARNHTVTQSTLDLPCVYKAGGAKSGFRPNPDNTPGKESFVFIVPDSEPKWFYCAQGDHCAEGMVFAINPKDKFPKFKETAKGANSTGSAPNSTIPSFPISTGAASSLTLKLSSVLLGLAAAVALGA